MEKSPGTKKDPEKAFCRDLLQWFGRVLEEALPDTEESLRDGVILSIVFFVLQGKYLPVRFVHSFLREASAERSYPGKILDQLPGQIRSLALFSGREGKVFPIPSQHAGTLGKILQYHIPILKRHDPSCQWIGRIFEMLLSCGCETAEIRTLSTRKQTGSFYTPACVVDYMVREALICYFRTEAEKGELVSGLHEDLFRRWIQDENGSVLPDGLRGFREELLQLLKACRILDPSCGSGNFLLGALRILTGLWNTLFHPSGRESSCKRKLFLLQNNLYGMDIQSMPLQIAQFCCFLELQKDPSAESFAVPEIKTNLFCTDALARKDPDPLRHAFHIVIGNPPYVPLPAIAAEERLCYKKDFSFACGRFNLFALFLEKSRYWMKQGGATSMWLVPDRVFLNTQGGALQNFLMKEMELFERVTFEKPLFSSATVHPVILGYRTKFLSENREGKILCRKCVAAADLKTAPAFYLTGGEVFSTSSAGPEEEVLHLRKKILEHSLLLGDLVRIRDGLIQGSIGKHLFLKEPPPDPAVCGKLLFGRNVSRYRIRFEENYVHYDVELMKSLEALYAGKGGSGLRMRKKELFCTPKILSRQTADGIIASLDEKGQYYYANTLHGSVQISGDHSLYFILGIMNSRLATFLYRCRSMEQGKTFAQIKIALLKELPVPAMGKALRVKIENLVRKILALHDSVEAPCVQESSSVLEKEIDREIYSFYKLTPDEIRLVESSPD